jgi:hypothetical protein
MRVLVRISDGGPLRSFRKTMRPRPTCGGPTSVEEARAFLACLEPGTPVAIEAVRGGGARGFGWSVGRTS